MIVGAAKHQRRPQIIGYRTGSVLS